MNAIIKTFFMISLLCFAKVHPEFVNNISRDFRQISREIVFKTGEKLKKKHGMEISGITMGLMDFVETVGLDFTINKPLDKNEARGLITSCANEFLKDFNECTEIRPFLQQYPMKPKNLKVTIYVNSLNGSQLFHPNIGIVSTYCGKVFYKTHEPDKEFGYKSVIEEPFDEAVRIVQAGIQNTND